MRFLDKFMVVVLSQNMGLVLFSRNHVLFVSSKKLPTTTSGRDVFRLCRIEGDRILLVATP